MKRLFFLRLSYLLFDLGYERLALRAWKRTRTSWEA